VARPHRVGLIVPSSNVTIETEVPRMLAAAVTEERVTFHSSRAVLHTVDPESLERMVAASDRCAAELADARVDVLAYACLVAVMARGHGAHEEMERRLGEVAAEHGCPVPVVSSAGALIRALARLKARRVAIITPYAPALTQTVAGYIESYGSEVVSAVSLNVTDNVAVGCLDPMALLRHADGLDLSNADVLVASACVQMPSLAALGELEARLGLPVISAATATAAEIVDVLGLEVSIPGVAPVSGTAA
jgi:maleate isomerase